MSRDARRPHPALLPPVRCGAVRGRGLVLRPIRRCAERPLRQNPTVSPLHHLRRWLRPRAAGRTLSWLSGFPIRPFLLHRSVSGYFVFIFSCVVTEIGAAGRRRQRAISGSCCYLLCVNPLAGRGEAFPSALLGGHVLNIEKQRGRRRLEGERGSWLLVLLGLSICSAFIDATV